MTNIYVTMNAHRKISAGKQLTLSAIPLPLVIDC